MNLIQLEYYVATIKYGSYARAGKAHFVSPQAVSKAVGDLEKELGVQLLSRSSNSITVTELGALFALKAQEVLDSAKDLTSIARSTLATDDARRQITIAVGTQPFRGCALTADQQKRPKESPEGRQHSLLFRTDDSCLAALNYDFAQAAIVLGRSHYDNQTSIKLSEASINVAMWDDHPLAVYPEIHITDLEREPIARPYNLVALFETIQQHLDLFKLKPLYHDVAPTFDSHAHFMKDNHGVVFVHGETMGLADEHIVIKELAVAEALTVPVCLVYRNNSFSPETLASFYKSICS